MWQPLTEAQILIAIDDGNIVENHNLDAKAIIGDTPRARKDTAQDLASFAINGGALIIGIGEDGPGVFSAAPFGLDRDVERVEQIAANLIDPPLFIRVSEIPSLVHPGKGYLFVEVPPSPQAPHMVGGAYFARGERTTRRLTDSEVLRLHARREDGTKRIRAELHHLVETDPIPSLKRNLSHFHFAAEPSTASKTAAVGLVRHADASRLHALLKSKERAAGSEIFEWAPKPTSARNYLRRSRGVAFSSNRSSGWNPLEDSEVHWVDIEVKESATIAASIGRGSDEYEELQDALVVAYTLRLVRWARDLSDEIEYRGSWDFAMAGTGLRGQIAHGRESHGHAGTSRYDIDTYEEVTSAHYWELTTTPGKVAQRLVGRLLRGLGTESLYDDQLG